MLESGIIKDAVLPYTANLDDTDINAFSNMLQMYNIDRTTTISKMKKVTFPALFVTSCTLLDPILDKSKNISSECCSSVDSRF